IAPTRIKRTAKTDVAAASLQVTLTGQLRPLYCDVARTGGEIDGAIKPSRADITAGGMGADGTMLVVQADVARTGAESQWSVCIVQIQVAAAGAGVDGPGDAVDGGVRRVAVDGDTNAGGHGNVEGESVLSDERPALAGADRDGIAALRVLHL